VVWEGEAERLSPIPIGRPLLETLTDWNVATPAAGEKDLGVRKQSEPACGRGFKRFPG